MVSCDFCGKNETEVVRMLSGDKVAICYNCLVHCVESIASANYEITKDIDENR